MKKFKHRIELRIDETSLKKLNKLCKSTRKTQSKILRESINQYFETRPLKELLIQSLKDPEFKKSLKNFLQSSPNFLHNFFEKLIGPYEEELAKQAILFQGADISFVTERGKRTYLKLLKK